MENDNLYPNTGQYFTPTIPKEQQKVREKEVEDTLDQLPLLKERVEYLENKIKYYGDVDSVTIDLDKDPAGHRNTLAAHKLMKTELQIERSWILTRVGKTIKR